MSVLMFVNHCNVERGAEDKYSFKVNGRHYTRKEVFCCFERNKQVKNFMMDYYKDGSISVDIYTD